MLDLTGILFSSVMMLIVIVRAVQLDRTEAWFQKVKPREGKVSPNERAWKRQS